MFDFAKQMHKWGCDISGYLTSGAITQSEYDEIMGDSNGSI
ncbi:XkdX family protein [Latilactobacillus curvatus]|nr:XkdX family protein [Latilactobacillus curvatus]AWV73257.1 XkdX family protein [Latilactobacillus curvatus]